MTVEELTNSIEQKTAKSIALENELYRLQSEIVEERKALSIAEYQAGLRPFYAGQKVIIQAGYFAWAKAQKHQVKEKDVDGQAGIVYDVSRLSDDLYHVTLTATPLYFELVPSRFLKAAEEEDTANGL